MDVAIASGKGGTGKTTVAVNLASYICNCFSKQVNNEVVLVDLDVEEPNSGIFLNAKEISRKDMFRKVPQWDKDKCIPCGKCNEVCNFNAIARLPETIMVFSELCHSCYACSELCPEGALPMVEKKMGELKHFESKNYSFFNNNMSFVESRLDIGEISAVPLIKQTKEYVDKNFREDIIKLYDSPPGTSCPVIETVKDVDFVILVTEPTPFGLHDLSLAVDTMKELKKKFAVVINRYGIGDTKVEQYCKTNDIPVIAKIPNMRAIADLYSQGKLVYDEIPEVKFELTKIFAYIYAEIDKRW